ncbi:DUF3592 domain-containing protein [Flavobacterium johnsoniae]|uniref:DUF3592 domain-containing protein n=1 Tax=Flavobacterium johnsoniae TaxID=986 RepID=UPI0025B1724D|nr:DUF3592 domain-containing protein [Flavobacterium johnsoniae]WJS96985.1 DUF3592 domain-containing protein [Flavobacterium johnsoniae]
MLFNKKYVPIFFAIFFILFVAISFYNILICLLLLGFLFLIYSIAGFIFLDNIHKNGIESIGKIVSYKSDEEGHKTPTIEYQTTDGKNFRGEPFIHASSDLDKLEAYQQNINTKIAILYSAKSPENFVIKERKSNSVILILFIFIGLALIGYSVISLIGKNDLYQKIISALRF